MSDNNETSNSAVAACPPNPSQISSSEGGHDKKTNDNHDRNRRGSGRSRGRGGGRGRNGSWTDKPNREKRARDDQGRAAYNHSTKKQRSYGQGTEENKVEGLDEEKEERKPKRKVAVLIGYCGTGYRGMQLNPPHKTIESDIFEAFVKAGAISRANSNDPKKSSLVRCARTDKGVHAAGNVISLKLIIEDPDIVQKINAELPEQIRVWGILRTLGSFSCYQKCDSRKYEYLLPTHCFLPPHPKTFLAQKLRSIAEKEGDLEGLLERQKEVDGWWDEVDDKVRKQLKDEDPELFKKAMYEESESDKEVVLGNDGRLRSRSPDVDINMGPMEIEGKIKSEAEKVEELRYKIRAVHRVEKRAYRISQERLARVREAFKAYEGTKNFHNYTINKTFYEASSKRHIKSFEVLDPIIINDTEWVSLRVHGQSFMMHQIRKMVGMAMMVVRTGCPIERIEQTFRSRKITIPKAPSLGLLLEYPVFESYNKSAVEAHSREPINFTLYSKEIDAFREKMIYSKLFEDERNGNIYTGFVHFLDSFKSPHFTYLSSTGFKALDEELEAQRNINDEMVADSEDEDAGSDAEAG
ncbi:uncharacterized protein H6S33_005173 [Morchella sextelata]|uniref:uncharacterized protein n=1 Tax=Morchella sextelata TaxID=1174677 RepID=UPI001D03ABD3|nr:uncharacterized protein H6S33_005173 [Morchella sextelata]KAH0605191.1 hypothetical protein H6S33_005173 [Morchella sextelata]